MGRVAQREGSGSSLVLTTDEGSGSSLVLTTDATQNIASLTLCSEQKFLEAAPSSLMSEILCLRVE